MTPKPLLLAVAILTSPSVLAQAPDRRLNVAFLVWEGMELIESMGPAHVFAFAPGMDEYTVSAKTDPIRSAFVTIVPQYRLDDCPKPDVIVIPGGSIWTPLGNETTRSWLEDHVPQTLLTVSVCNSAILLAELGLLDGHEATCANGNLDDIMIRGKNVKGLINRRWVHSGNIITSKSYLGGVDAAIYAVRVLRGEEGERQVLGWSNYEGDLSKFDALHAQPGIVPISRRREIHEILMTSGVDAAVQRFRAWVESNEPAYTPPLDEIPEEDMFQWMAWGYQREEEFDRSLRICTFKVAVWPESAKHRAYLGEAYHKKGDLEKALEHLLEAESMEPGNSVALRLLERALHDPAIDSSPVSLRGRELLRSHASTGLGRLVNRDEPGDPLHVSGQVLNERDAAISGARIHAYQADADGHYSKTRPRDPSTSRLFAFVRADEAGRFALETVRPGAPPAPEESRKNEEAAPARVHLEVEAEGYVKRYLELFFSDDPRLTEAWRIRARREGHAIAAVTKETRRSRCELEVRLTRE